MGEDTEDTEDTWASLADQFADEAYATVKGYVRTYVMHQQLLEQLPPPPATVLDVGGGAGHQSFPLAQAGYEVTLLDPSQAMLDKARQRLERGGDCWLRFRPEDMASAVCVAVAVSAPVPAVKASLPTDRGTE